ncbi:proline iminopeptidase [Lentzea sp. NBRC 105346]|uniref:prolyl aminopeptidase n=1 Tax=Lentzea sp. NBRC 105346 TaxID=3032205 RepID=UPI0024A18AD2|nr:prolyl aminopeptidase [Lentzea sp. NBRC 105346]GLZ28478.1 proline iminopeptidase [Lentzea sp. NBRC 105346]
MIDDHGLLDVGDGNHVYWETCGAPDGKPALFVHGGPGSGCSPRSRNVFIPHGFRGILFDQRGCGRSIPHAAGPDVDMSVNTTWHLVEDMEKLREHLGVEKWLLYGGSWGCTLILAYAQKYPHRVSEIVMASITSGRRAESDWLYRGAARFFPEEWARFRSLVSSDDVISEYSRLMEHPETRAGAAAEWSRWEDVVVSREPGARPNMYSDKDEDALIAFARITSWYCAHGAWLEEGQLIGNADRLAGIPGVLVHGLLDLSCPFNTAWELAKAWPDAELVALPNTGHQATDERRDTMRRAMEKFSA